MAIRPTDCGPRLRAGGNNAPGLGMGMGATGAVGEAVAGIRPAGCPWTWVPAGRAGMELRVPMSPLISIANLSVVSEGLRPGW